MQEIELTITNPELRELILAVTQRKAGLKFQARGLSMAPFIKDGDVVTVSYLDGDNIGLGTVVAFSQPESKSLALHRVVAKKDNFYLIKGDNTYASDGWVERKNILAYVCKVERKGKGLRLGLGPEKMLIAFLSRRNWLKDIFLAWRRIFPERLRKAFLARIF